jgi:hypothetical protein
MNHNIKITIIRFSLIIIIVSLLTGSCTGRKKKVDRSGLIPEKELVSLLYDISVTDGLMTISKVQHWFPRIDSTSSYFHIIEKHGYTKQVLEKTMKYYYIKNPKGLIKIYDKVLAKLSEMESLAEKESASQQGQPSNLWKGKKIYSLPDPSGNDSVTFDLNLNRSGSYTLWYTVTLFPGDQAVNPRVTAYTTHPDSIGTGKRRYIGAVDYLKDGQPHTYTMVINVPRDKIFNLRICFYDYDNYLDEWGKNALIENITLIYTYVLV